MNKICGNSNKFEEIQANFANFNKKNHQNSLILLSGFPDRLALRLTESRKNPDGSTSPVYQFPSGRKAVLHNSKHSQAKWIAAPEVMAGQSEGVIFDFEELTDAEVESWLSSRTQSKIICHFENGKILKSENICYGELVLSSKKLLSTKEDYAAAWMTEIRTKGMEALPLDDKCENFLERIKFYAQQNPQNSQLDEKISGLTDAPESWLLPFITSSSLTSQTIYDALNYQFGEFNIEENVPLQITLQNRNRAKIKYEKLASPDDKTRLVIRPVIEIIIQRAFGCTITPKIAGMKVLFRLLSPAQRPLQITDDLEGFWTGTWPQICKEMKGRYPKHNWDVNRPEKG
ncbi:HrpA-like helicase [Treponema sp. JC4]|nr:HrpA-like helicase [Treponema sp. JC4]